MSVDTRAVIVVGLPRCDIKDQSLLDDETLTVVPPCYDGGGRDYAIAGMVVCTSDCYEPAEIFNVHGGICCAAAEFERLTGQVGKAYISPYIF